MRLLKASRVLKKAVEATNTVETLKASPLDTLVETYFLTIIINDNGKDKTNYPSSEILSEDTVTQAFKINLKILGIGSGTLVGLGLLGTFLGLTWGIKGLDVSTSETIQQSIQTLLDGMETAFSTSLLGMFLSLIFSFLDKKWSNELFQALHKVTEKLDSEYYIDDAALARLNQEKAMEDMRNDQKQLIKELGNRQEVMMTNLRNNLIDVLRQQLSYSNEEGANVQISNAIREILKENQEQSKALKSFSTDLALELNNGFDETLSRQMQSKILPLMENVDKTTRAIVEHIDQMAESIATPATDMIQQVVDKLENSMSMMMNEFKNNISENTSHQLELVANTLTTASQSLGDFPKNMGEISTTLQTTIDEVKKAVTDISSASATSNDKALEKMQEQIALATTAMSETITEVKKVMSDVTASSEKSSQEVITKLSEASEQMSKFMSSSISEMSTSMQASIQEMLGGINGAMKEVTSAVGSVTQASESTSQSMRQQFASAAEQMGTVLQSTVTNVSNSVEQTMRDVVNGISGKQAEINSVMTSSVNQMSTSMQDSMREMLSGINAAMRDFTSAVGTAAQASESSSQSLIEKLAQAADQMGVALQSTMSNMSNTVEQTMKNVATDLTDKQTDLLALQESTVEETKKMLEIFDKGLERLEEVNSAISSTLSTFHSAYGEISDTTSNLRLITTDIKNATQEFNKTQTEYADHMNTLQQTTQDNIEAVNELLKGSGEMSNEYVEKFETIKSGLTQIFSHLQNGLNNYSQTVKTSLEGYLNKYTENLTRATEALASTVSQQGEIVDSLTEVIGNRK